MARELHRQIVLLDGRAAFLPLQVSRNITESANLHLLGVANRLLAEPKLVSFPE